MEKIEIYSSKKKVFLLLISSVFFVITCFFLAAGVFDAALFLKLVGVMGVVLFGLGIYVAIKHLIRSKLMLIIDDTGININPEKNDEKILWQHIEGFPVISINGSKIILINVNNPQYWIDKETNKIRKKFLAINYNNYAAPFSLSSNSMQIKHKELVELLNKRLAIYILKNKNFN